jgi:DNA-binding response OmpR family regulator
MPGERILIVEDEPSVARGLVYGLENEGYDVRWASTGGEAVATVATFDPHVILLDIRLPDVSGFDVCRRLRGSGHKTPILMLTARDEAVDKVLGLELGADDYVVKPFDLRELIARIRSLLRRSYGDLAVDTSADRLSFGPLEIDPGRMTVTNDGARVDLTPIEFRLLRHMAGQPGRPFTRSQLISAAWDYEGDVGSDRTVDVHIRHLREKIEADPATPRWIITVRGVGYKLEAGNEGPASVAKS